MHYQRLSFKRGGIISQSEKTPPRYPTYLIELVDLNGVLLKHLVRVFLLLRLLRLQQRQGVVILPPTTTTRRRRAPRLSRGRSRRGAERQHLRLEREGRRGRGSSSCASCCCRAEGERGEAAAGAAGRWGRGRGGRVEGREGEEAAGGGRGGGGSGSRRSCWCWCWRGGSRGCRRRRGGSCPAAPGAVLGLERARELDVVLCMSCACVEGVVSGVIASRLIHPIMHHLLTPPRTRTPSTHTE